MVLAASARLLELLFGESQDQLAANSVQQATLNAVYTRFTSTTEEASRVGTLLGADMRAARMEAQNCHNRLLAEVETGGYRESGIGRLHGIEAMNDFLETKHIYLEAES